MRNYYLTCGHENHEVINTQHINCNETAVAKSNVDVKVCKDSLLTGRPPKFAKSASTGENELCADTKQIVNSAD